MRFGGWDVAGEVRAFELGGHPFFMGTLFQPERSALAGQAHPLIQAYLAAETAKLSATFADDVKSLADWQAKRPEYVEQYYYMLGLSPRPEKTPLAPTITGTLKGDGYEVDMIHYQSVPHLYVTGNLYRPAKVKEGEKLPAIFATFDGRAGHVSIHRKSATQFG